MATEPPIPKSFEDARLRHLEVEKELERICSAVHFRTSKRACEFLRYVVRVALDGRMDSLKERAIGIDLLGRDVSYDPSSDAVVRVRANDVRKRLTSHYASPDVTSKIQINLPLGTYIPRFIPHEVVAEKPDATLLSSTTVEALEAIPFVRPLENMILMRPALLALLLCVLLMRHRLEDRESYLRFWDHILSGRNVLLLSVTPQDEAKLAPSLYPVAWIAGRYGVDTAVESSMSLERKPDQLASVQASLTTPLALAKDQRLRWTLTGQQGAGRVTDRVLRNGAWTPDIASAALLTILPEDTTTLHVQGTDHEAIEHLLQDMTSQKNFPEEALDSSNGRNLLQVLLLHTVTGQWKTQIFHGDAQ